MHISWLSRFEFHLPHPILSPALATNKQWPLSQFHISYQNSEISWPKMPISNFQSQFSMSKIIWNFLKMFFIEEIFCYWHALYLLKLGPLFDSWVLVTDMEMTKGHFLSVAKIVQRIGCGNWYSNLKRHLLCI